MCHLPPAPLQALLLPFLRGLRIMSQSVDTRTLLSAGVPRLVVRLLCWAEETSDVNVAEQCVFLGRSLVQVCFRSYSFRITVPCPQ